MCFLFINVIHFGYKVHAQNLTLAVQSSSLNFDYSKESDFETARTIQKALKLTVSSRNRGIFVYGRIQPSANVQMSSVPQTPFGVKVNYSPVNISSSYFQPRNLTFSDITVLAYNSKITRPIAFDFDLILNAIGYTIAPENYDYSIIFTLTEQ
jgi:hypothetical protein